MVESTNTPEAPQTVATFTPSPTLAPEYTSTPTPTNTPTPKPTHTPTPTATSTATPVPYIVTENANVRSGPGTAFAIVGSREQGSTLTPLARTFDNEWIQIGNTEWIWSGLVTGKIEQLNVAQNIPSTPTLIPTSTPSSSIPVFTVDDLYNFDDDELDKISKKTIGVVGQFTGFYYWDDGDVDIQLAQSSWQLDCRVFSHDIPELPHLKYGDVITVLGIIDTNQSWLWIVLDPCVFFKKYQDS